MKSNNRWEGGNTLLTSIETSYCVSFWMELSPLTKESFREFSFFRITMSPFSNPVTFLTTLEGGFGLTIAKTLVSSIKD